jgi:hypothetical protein
MPIHISAYFLLSSSWNVVPGVAAAYRAAKDSFPVPQRIIVTLALKLYHGGLVDVHCEMYEAVLFDYKGN